MSTTYQKDLEELIDDAERQEWGHRITDGGHHQLFAPDGKSIVTAPSTPSDHRSFANLLAEMKRSGYKPPDDRERLMAKRHDRGITELVRDVMRKYPDRVFDVNALHPFVAGKFPQFQINNTGHNALSRLYLRGEIARIGPGQYRWGAETPPPTPPVKVTPQAPPLPAFDPDAIDDEKELDEALVALSKIEGVVRRHREVARQLRELRRLLGLKAGGS